MEELKMNNKRIVVITFLLVALAVRINAQDWPQYLGPNRNSTSAQKGIFRTFPANGPEVLWTANVGPGFGGSVIKDGKVYLLDRDDKTGDIMRCFDFKTGKELWKFSYDAPGSVPFPGSRSMPIADGNYVYSCGHNGDLYCFDVNTHKPVWHKNVWTDFGGGSRIPMFGVTQCPLVYGNLLIVASQTADAGVVAYEKLTGNVKWETPSVGPVGYVSPTTVKIDGKDQIVMVTASTPESKGTVAGIEPLTGKILWEFKNWECGYPSTSVVDAGKNKVLVLGGYEVGAIMLQIEKKAGGEYGATELFRTNEFGAHTQPAILNDGFFYSQYTTNERRDGLVCMSMDGKIMWKTGRSPLFDKGGMILVDGVILATDGKNSLYVIDPSPEAFKPLATSAILKTGSGTDDDQSTGPRMFGGVQNWAPLALTDGKLLIRDQSRLMCVRVAK